VSTPKGIKSGFALTYDILKHKHGLTMRELRARLETDRELRKELYELQIEALSGVTMLGAASEGSADAEEAGSPQDP